MAPKKAPKADTPLAESGDLELDQAIDDLRGVLKQDAGGTPETDFGADFATPEGETDLSAFGGDFGSLDESTVEEAAGGDFGSSDFASGDFGGGDFGGSDFGGGDFAASSGGTDFGAAAFGQAAPAGAAPGSALSSNHDLIMDIPIDVQIVLGQSRMQVSGLMNLTEGATIALDRRIGEPVEIVVNGRVIGRGEITVLEEDETRFGVKIIEVKSTRKV